ncbi:hypothetical protein BaRGS_00004382 [Batillaria attramentaria]|uniref:Uncharacterized protein n=1 Tax=Batillaria attramentaria TaxID=370345 RepID=A0ABD0LZ38_9CAEN
MATWPSQEGSLLSACWERGENKRGDRADERHCLRDQGGREGERKQSGAGKEIYMRIESIEFYLDCCDAVYTLQWVSDDVAWEYGLEGGTSCNT